MFISTLFPLVFLSLTVSATPIANKESFITLNLSKSFFNKGPVNLLKTDQARVASRLQITNTRGSTTTNIFNRQSSIDVTNVAVTYVATVNIGEPPTNYTLLVDTGSSNTWVGATKPYVKTRTSVETPDNVSVKYGSGGFSGREILDIVTLGNGLKINNQSIGVASRHSDFQGLDGILGIGPVELTRGTLLPHNNALIPTVADNLFSQRVVPANLFGISFNPTSQLEANNGEITFGGVDDSKYTGSITYAPITSASPSKMFWGIDQRMTYGTSQTSILSGAGITDTGTTLILLATDAYMKYKLATGATFDRGTGLLRLPNDKFDTLQSLHCNIAGTTYELTPNAQLWPRSLNGYIDGDSDHVYLIIGDLGSSSTMGFSFVMGYTFLERFYSVYDTANKRIGFATTSFTKALVN